MAGQAFEPRGLTRRDFLVTGLRRRLAAVLGGAAAGAAPADVGAGELSPRDLRAESRAGALAAVDRIRARRRVGRW